MNRLSRTDCPTCGNALGPNGCLHCRAAVAAMVAQSIAGTPEEVPALMRALALQTESHIAGETVIDAEPSFGCPERTERHDCALTYPHALSECWEHGSGMPRRPAPTMAPDVLKRWERARLLRHLAWRIQYEAEQASREFVPCSDCGKSPVEGCVCVPF